MSLLYFRPRKTETYAHYLLGLGLGMWIGGLAAAESTEFPKLAFIGGLFFMCLAVYINREAKKNGGKNGKKN